MRARKCQKRFVRRVQEEGSSRGRGGCKSFDPATSEKPNRKSSERKWRLISKRQRSYERRRQIQRYRQREREIETDRGRVGGEKRPAANLMKICLCVEKSSEN